MSSNAGDALDVLQRQLSPLVAVIATPEADKIVRKNHLALHELLSIAQELKEPVIIKDHNGQSAVHQRFSVRFQALDSIVETDPIDFKIQAAHLKEASPKLLSDTVHVVTKKTVQDVTRNGMKSLAPWYEVYRDTIMDLSGSSEHDSFNHPTCCLIAVSVQEPDPYAAFINSYNMTKPPEIFERLMMDTNILKYYLLLHDVQQDSLEKSQALLERLRSTFGPNTSLLKINSKAAPTPDSPDSSPDTHLIWKTYSAIAQKSATLAKLRALNQGVPSSSSEDSLSSNLSVASIDQKPSIALDNSAELPRRGAENSSVCSQVHYGSYLTKDDVDNINRCVQEMVSGQGGLIPWMQRCVLNWNQQVAALRRGITNKLFSAGKKYFGGGKEKSNAIQITRGDQTLIMFPANSPESQMRRLADYSFMLRNYDLALQVYELARKDFVTEKAWKHVAGTYEMMAVTSLLCHTPLPNQSAVFRPNSITNFVTSINSYIESCFSSYGTSTPISSFISVRSCLLIWEAFKAAQLFKDGSRMLVRMAADESTCGAVGGAVLLEQVAWAYILGSSDNLWIRKWGFNLVCSGHKYSRAGLRDHAYHAYRQSLSLYGNTKQQAAQKTLFPVQEEEGWEPDYVQPDVVPDWLYIVEHVHFTLARQSFHTGDIQSAMQWFVKLLSRSPISTPLPVSLQVEASNNVEEKLRKVEEGWIREAYFVYKEFIKACPQEEQRVFEDLKFPYIEDDQIRMKLKLFENSIEHSGEDWSSMRRHFESEITPKNTGNSNSNNILAAEDSTFVCAVNEPLVVIVPMVNPFRIPLKITDVLVECTQESECQIIKVDELTLEAKEKKDLHIEIIPIKEGKLKVLAITYRFAGIIPVRHPFLKKGVRLNATLQHKLNPTYDTSNILLCNVIESMPLLNVQFIGWPTSSTPTPGLEVIFDAPQKKPGMTECEMCQCEIEFRNEGKRALSRIWCMIGGSRSCQFQFSATNQRDSDATVSKSFTTSNKLYDPNCFEVDFQGILPNGVLLPGESIKLPIVIRAQKRGKHLFRFLFKYIAAESQSTSKTPEARYLKKSWWTVVYPLMQVSAFTKPSYTNGQSAVLGLDIRNMTNDFDIELTGVYGIGCDSRLSLMNDTSEGHINPTKLPPEKSLLYFFKVTSDKDCLAYNPEKITAKRLGQLLTGQIIDSHNSDVELQISHIQGNADPELDSSSLPKDRLASLIYFHKVTKLHYRQAHLNSLYATIPYDKRSLIFPIFHTNDIDILITWKHASQNVHGCLILCGINTGLMQNTIKILGHQPSVTTKLLDDSRELSKSTNDPDKMSSGKVPRSLYSQTESEKNQLLQTLTRSANAKEDCPLTLRWLADDMIYIKNSCTLLALHVEIKNNDWYYASSFELRLMNSLDSEMYQGDVSPALIPKYNNSKRSFQFAGSCINKGFIKSQETQLLEILVEFPQPGLYDLNRWEFEFCLVDEAVEGNGDQHDFASIQLASHQQQQQRHWKLVPHKPLWMEVRDDKDRCEPPRFSDV